MMEMVAQHWKKIGIQPGRQGHRAQPGHHQGRQRAPDLRLGRRQRRTSSCGRATTCRPSRTSRSAARSTPAGTPRTAPQGKKPEDPELLKAYDMLRKGCRAGDGRAEQAGPGAQEADRRPAVGHRHGRLHADAPRHQQQAGERARPVRPGARAPGRRARPIRRRTTSRADDTRSELGGSPRLADSATLTPAHRLCYIVCAFPALGPGCRRHRWRRGRPSRCYLEGRGYGDRWVDCRAGDSCALDSG